MKDGRYQILLTNDDGIASPGLWVAAEALSTLGFVTVVAPREQSSGTGRSLPVTSDGRIHRQKLNIRGQEWTVYAVGGTPGQAVQHGILEIMDTKPDLVVSGINYGENLGTSITVSGTVGAALEAAACGVPALATSLQLLNDSYYDYSREIDFSTTAFFTHKFANLLLEQPMPPDVHLLKLDVPAKATPETPWRVTRVSNHRYYIPRVRRLGGWDDPGAIEGLPKVSLEEAELDSDVRAVVFDGVVSVSPLSLDLTSRIPALQLEGFLRSRG
jgi:5'-nucleotidase